MLAKFHSESDFNESETLASIIPRICNQLERKLTQNRKNLEHLYNITVPYTELSKDFSVDTTIIERSKHEIKTSSIDQLREIAESWLLRAIQSEEHIRRQADRMRALELKLSACETSLKSQIDFNDTTYEIVHESLEHLSKREEKRVEMVKQLQQREDTRNKELERLRSDYSVLEQNNGIINRRMEMLYTEKNQISEQLITAQADKRAAESQLEQMIEENQRMDKFLKDKETIIDKLRNQNRDDADKILQLEAAIREQTTELGEMNSKWAGDRQQFRALSDQKEIDFSRRMEDQKKEIERRLKQEHLADMEKLKKNMTELRRSYEIGLEEALKEVRALAAERQEFYSKYNDLKSKIDAHKRKLNAKVSRQVFNKATEMIMDLNICEADGNNSAPALRPLGNITERLLNNLRSDPSSGISTPPNNSQPQN